MKNFLFVLLLTFCGLASQAQSLANTKNIRLKGMYDFQTEFNEFRVNSFLKHRFEEHGYTVIYDMEEKKKWQVETAPSCDELICVVTRDKAMLATKLEVVLINCKGDVVFKANGESRLKIRSKSHVDALKNALELTVFKAKIN